MLSAVLQLRLPCATGKAMTCTQPHCTGTALRYVGRQFFCEEHKEQAYAAAKIDNRLSASMASVARYEFELFGGVHRVAVNVEGRTYPEHAS